MQFHFQGHFLRFRSKTSPSKEFRKIIVSPHLKLVRKLKKKIRQPFSRKPALKLESKPGLQTFPKP
jgi:hypothetical protein